MLRVGEDLSYAHPDLSDELYLVNREIRAGYSWDEALCNLSERTGVDDIKALVNALVQAGPLGVVMAVDAAPEDREVVADESRSLKQRLVKTGGRLVKHARYYWLFLAEGHLNL